MKAQFIFILFYLLVANISLASERATVCAKYWTNTGWSNGYKVEATIIKGGELNRATKSFNYNSIATYVVIFWNQDQASVIQMSTPFFRFAGQPGIDQQGRKWQIARTKFCY